MNLYSKDELDFTLDRMFALTDLLSFLQDTCDVEERRRLANAEGYIVEILRAEIHAAQQNWTIMHRQPVEPGCVMT